MELEKEITNQNNLEINNNINNQKNFLNSTFGKIIDNATDIGIRYILPDLIEDEVIEIKDVLLKSGFKEGINTAIDKAMDIGKSALGIVTGNFENISQVKMAVESGGIIDSVSSVLDKVINIARDNELIDRNIARLIKNSKNTILENVSKNIEDTLTEQVKNIENLEKYSQNWKKYFNEKNFYGMEKEYIKIEEKLKELIPLESIINMSRNIETVHNLIKNNGKNFDLSTEEIQLINNLNQ